MDYKKLKRKFIIYFSHRFSSPNFYLIRAKIIFTLFLSAFLLLLGRGLWLHLFSATKILKTIAHQQYRSSIKISPYRGTIYDHRYVPLAISIKTPSLAVNPRVFSPSTQEVKSLSKVLKIPPEKIRVTENRKNYFAWLKRKIGTETMETVNKLGIDGLYSIMESARYYPQGENAAHLIGFVGTDDNGLFGLERTYDKKLKGASGESIRLRDARGNSIFLTADEAMPEQAGYNLILTVDSVIQEIAEKTLAKWVENAKAKAGFALVADPHTGRILAIANQPTFDPNNPQNIKIANTNNLAVSAVFEPGSVMKSFVISSAIEAKLTNENEVHNCEKGRLQIDKRNAIHDDHPKEFLTTAEVLMYSSNICVFKIAKRLGKRGLWNAMRNFGFGKNEPMSDFPNATGGRLSSPDSWAIIRFANISFGQGILVNGLEVVRGYSVFANGGNLVNLHIIDRIETEDGRIIYNADLVGKNRILSPKTVNIMRDMLEKVVLEGSAPLAKTQLFTTAGKTGTAQKVDPLTGRYSHDKNIADFVGFAPVNDPHILVYIVIDEPKEKPYYGGKWAAPAFSEITTQTLKYLNVAPDKIPDGETIKSLTVNP